MFQFAPSQDASKIRLFCFPHAGAGPSAFRGWAAALGPDIETHVIELPGREARFNQAHYRHLPDLVRDATDAIVGALAVGQQFALFGNSFGALVAFEAAQRIRRQTGREPSHLFMAAAYAAHLPPSMAPLSLLSDPQLVKEVSERYDGIPGPVKADQGMLAAVLGALRADLSLVDAYPRRPPEPFDCPLTAFGGRHDRTIPSDQLWAWEMHTKGPFTCILLEQGHLFLQSERSRLTAYIREALVGAPAVLAERELT
jgi:medium-chain acyl-[acyl-carrier-protein] hydrolase